MIRAGRWRSGPIGGRRAGPRLLRARGRAGDGDRRDLLLGYLDAGSELAGGAALDAEAAEAAVAELGDELGLSPLETAQG